MVIQELKPSKRVRGRWLAVLEDGSLLRVGEGEVIQFALCAGRELTEEEAERLQAAVRTGGLKEKALNLLAGRPMSRRELEEHIAVCLGGRVAEQLVLGDISTGASNDIEQATKLARAMITRYGMSDDFDMVALETVTNQYLGGDASLACSTDTQTKIDQQVVELVKRQHEKANRILSENREKLDELARYLYEKETITGDEFMEILNQ